MSRRRRVPALRLSRPTVLVVVALLSLVWGWTPATPAASVAAPGAGPAGTVVAAGEAHPNQFDKVKARLEGVDPVWQVIVIIGLTLVSEDLTCIVVGLLIHTGELEWWIGGLACFFGIYVGDLGLFFAGRLFGSRLLKFKLFSHGFGAAKLEEFGRWFERRPWAALAMCRVAPGLRMPLFLSVGALTKKTTVFFWWTCFFAFVWTPLLVGLVAVFGQVIVGPFERFFGGGWKGIAVAVVVVFVTIRLVTLLSTKEGRLKIRCRVDKLFGRPSVCEEPLTEPGSHKHPPGVAPVVHPSPKLTGEPIAMPEPK